MDKTAKELRDLIALYRKLAERGDVGVNLTRHFLNEIVLAEMQLGNLDDHENAKSDLTNPRP
jgi:hypothetical protein